MFLWWWCATRTSNFSKRQTWKSKSTGAWERNKRKVSHALAHKIKISFAIEKRQSIVDRTNWTLNWVPFHFIWRMQTLMPLLSIDTRNMSRTKNTKEIHAQSLSSNHSQFIAGYWLLVESQMPNENEKRTKKWMRRERQRERETSLMMKTSVLSSLLSVCLSRFVSRSAGLCGQRSFSILLSHHIRIRVCVCDVV